MRKTKKLDRLGDSKKRQDDLICKRDYTAATACRKP